MLQSRSKSGADEDGTSLGVVRESWTAAFERQARGLFSSGFWRKFRAKMALAELLQAKRSRSPLLRNPPALSVYHLQAADQHRQHAVESKLLDKLLSQLLTRWVTGSHLLASAGLVA